MKEKKFRKAPQNVDQGDGKRGNYLKEAKRKLLYTFKDLDAQIFLKMKKSEVEELDENTTCFLHPHMGKENIVWPLTDGNFLCVTEGKQL